MVLSKRDITKKKYRNRERYQKYKEGAFNKKDYPYKFDYRLLCAFFLDGINIESNRIRHIDKYPNIKSYLLNRYKDNEGNNYNEILHRIKYHIEVYPKCIVCGNRIPYRNVQVLFGNKYCSVKCAANSERIKEKKKETSIKKYGVEHPAKSKEIKEKIRLTCLHKYGCESYLTSSECKKNLLDKYGVEYPFQSRKILEKCKETVIRKYGVDNYSKTQECHAKILSTCLERYGVTSWTKTKEFKKIMEENKETMNDKRIATKIKNNTLNTSYEEQRIYKFLKQIYPNILTQYKNNKKYPFNCDFYIPEYDLYIEYQGYPSHGDFPYKNDAKCNEILEVWKQKQYTGWIYDWTKRDVMKRNCAKKNNLNYIEFFHYDISLIKETIENYINKGCSGQIWV